MAKFHELTVKEVRRETADTVSVSFDVPEQLKAEFAFIQGQYLTFRKEIAGEEVRRSYSICSSPLEGELRVAIKRVEGGRFSTYANKDLKVGDVLETMPPQGNFHTEMNESNATNYVLFASGSGITPVISIVKTVLASEPKSKVTLFYGNKNFDSIIFREELEGLKNQYMERFRLFHVLSREGLGSELYNGRIDEEKCASWSGTLMDMETSDEFFICGPFTMIEGVSGWLKNQGVDKKNVHFELFSTAGAPAPPKKAGAPASSDSDSHITVILDGDTFQFDLNEGGASILDAANGVGGDLPFACKGGVCCTCRAKVLEGKVEMEQNYALEEDELEAGFVLTCQSHPTTEKVVISFDEV